MGFDPCIDQGCRHFRQAARGVPIRVGPATTGNFRED